jgi:phosphodiester glycosidase
MKSRRNKIFISIFVFLLLCVGSVLFYDRGRPAPVPMKKKLYDGIIYRRIVRVLPRPMIIHVVVIDTQAKGISFLVTPPDSNSDQPLKARTTTQFLHDFGLQIAINGDGFTPWWSHSPADYYPHVGDPITPLGFSAAKGEVYWSGKNSDDIGIEPTLYISRGNALSFNVRPNRVYNAISGDRMLLQRGEIEPGLDDEELDPRTAIGLNRNGRYLYLLVVDGRQPFYSQGATFAELAELLKKQGAVIGMSLDGGGSSTLVIEGSDGQPEIMNSPIDNYIPGRERPVGNHLGVFVK